MLSYGVDMLSLSKLCPEDIISNISQKAQHQNISAYVVKQIYCTLCDHLKQPPVDRFKQLDEVE
jgi:hypothetical protein